MENPINKRISLTLKNLRSERGWSLDKTSLETGVSKAMLGQIEREESSPTIATLWKIACGFHTSFSSFIDELDTNSTTAIHRVSDRQQLHSQDEKIRIMPLFPYDNELHFELFVIELLPGCEHMSPPHDKGVIEHVIVTEGQMELLVDGQWKQLKKGDGFRFSANQAHGYKNTSTQIACIHDVIHYPT